MLGFRPIATAPLATLLAELQVGQQTVTVRYGSESFVTRSTDNPSDTFIAGRINRGLQIGRRISDGEDGQFGSLIESRFGEVDLNNTDGALDTLVNDFYGDGREIRLKIGAREIIGAQRIMPRFIGTSLGSSSGDASVPYILPYPTISLFEEAWSGSNGAAWSSDRWNAPDLLSGSPTESVIDIQSNAGRVLAQGVSGARARIISKSGPMRNFELSTQVTIVTGNQTANSEFHAINFRASGGWSATNSTDRQNGYALRFVTFGGTQSVVLSSIVDGARTNLASAAKSFGTSAWSVRVQCIDSEIKAKAWQGTQPGTWDIEVTNTDHALGDLSLATVNGADTGGRTAIWDALHVDEVTAAPSIPGDLFIAQITINDRGEAPVLGLLQYSGSTVAYGGQNVEY